ncbi:MAG TPA: TlpA family protein disulfide reductase [Cytophagales bacterium]|jgi:thiol-disulfide isomerase/thioredoxin|nr:TlpA family protein disulfide reductase [Cytophagales bacterium]
MIRSIFLSVFILYSSTVKGQELIRMPQLQKIINEGEKIKVINFWATWCAPCVKEMPLFEKLNAENKNVKVILVSMDYDLDPNPEKVKRFIDRKKIESKVVILAEENPNNWIDKIDKNWSGALPTTLILNNANGKRKLIEGELDESLLNKTIAEISE